jgi:hypothetical protein
MVNYCWKDEEEKQYQLLKMEWCPEEAKRHRQALLINPRKMLYFSGLMTATPRRVKVVCTTMCCGCVPKSAGACEAVYRRLILR